VTAYRRKDDDTRELLDTVRALPRQIHDPGTDEDVDVLGDDDTPLHPGEA
jgi:hypothetical protein